MLIDQLYISIDLSIHFQTLGSSSLDKLFLVVNFGVQFVKLSNQVAASERIIWLLEIGLLGLYFSVKLLPLLVKVLSVLLVLLDGIQLLLLWVHLESLIESKWVNFLEDGLESYQGLLQYLVPMVLGQINDDGHQHWESLLLVGFQDVQEVVILEEAHGSIGNLQMDTTNALYDPLEQSWNKVLHLVDLANLEDLLQLGQEESLLDAVGEWPVLEEAFEKGDGQSSVFG